MIWPVVGQCLSLVIPMRCGGKKSGSKLSGDKRSGDKCNICITRHTIQALS